jgi:hypothetical protein
MKIATQNSAIGLDIGTSRIVSAVQAGDGYEYKSELNSFITLPLSKMTEQVLRRENIPHAVVGSSIIVHGNESERFADLLQMDTRRPMTRGTLNASEPESVNMIRAIITSMVGPAKFVGQKLCFSVPAAPLGGSENLTYHEATVKQVLVELGYDTRSINEGLAVVYAELESSNYTGIGISCGGGLCNVCLSYLAVPVANFSVAKAGDYIDASAAGVTGDLSNRIRLIKEDSFEFSAAYKDKTHQVLSVYYEDMIQALVAGLNETFQNSRSMPRLARPIPLVLSGGSAVPVGFRDRFETILKLSNFPIALSEIRVSEDPMNSTAKGALVSALSDM